MNGIDIFGNVNLFHLGHPFTLLSLVGCYLIAPPDVNRDQIPRHAFLARKDEIELALRLSDHQWGRACEQSFHDGFLQHPFPVFAPEDARSDHGIPTPVEGHQIPVGLAQAVVGVESRVGNGVFDVARAVQFRRRKITPHGGPQTGTMGAVFSGPTAVTITTTTTTIVAGSNAAFVPVHPRPISDGSEAPVRFDPVAKSLSVHMEIAPETKAVPIGERRNR
mmetsp:Transcript_73943/g.150113  ORF Transcript_73943/g.150113 Transcript_73943/m.150113 type:complete len:221 (-) Transcript_73943:367-1029(-)